MTTRVGVSSDLPEILRNRRLRPADIEAALSSQKLLRRKFEGVWLYGTTDEAITSAEDAVGESALAILDRWLLGSLHPLSGYIAKHLTSPSVSRNAVLPILKSMMRSQRLGGVAVFTNRYQAYLSAFAPADQEEIDRLVDFMRVKLEKDGTISAPDLPTPMKKRTLPAWRDVVVRHGEYIGLGYIVDGVLVSWP